MEQENANFREGSPILVNSLSFNGSQDSDNNLESLLQDLVLHLKRQKNIPKNELKSYLKQLSGINPQNYTDRQRLKKVEGMLKFMLKKRSDFINCLLNDEVEIYGKSSTHSQANLSPQASSSSSQEFSMRMLTNNNFMSSDNIRMEVDNYSKPSTQDLFSNNSTQELHNFAQENYQLLKSVVANPVLENSSNDYIFKRPHPVQKVFQIHESLEENFNSIVSLASSTAAEEVIEIETDEYSQNIFDQAYETDRSLKEFEEMSSVVREWVIDRFISNLAKIKETDTSQNSSNQGVKIKPLYTEENYKTMKEICERFKENLKTRKEFDFLNL